MHESPTTVKINAAVAHIPLTTPRAYTWAIIRDVAKSHGVEFKDIFARDRRRPVIEAKRAAIVAVMVNKPHLSLPQVAEIFGLDHTTALHHAQTAGLPSRKAVSHG